MKSTIINGVKTYAPSSRSELVEYIEVHKGILVAVNAEKILHATDETRAIFNQNIGYPDGEGAVMALKKKGIEQAIKIPGCEFWLDLCKAFEGKKSFYLVGAKPEVIEQTVQKLRQEFPKLLLVGHRDGYLRTVEEKKDLLLDIQEKKPEVVFVAMGSPKQEYLMAEMMKVNPAIYQGLGGSFDVYTGNVKRAPAWWVNNKLEWAYRLIKEPTRIKRQWHLVRFLIRVKLNRI